jgi:hypothetical protein
MKPAFKPVVLTVALCTSAILAPAMAAEFYKWVDEDGNTVYSGTPPPKEVKADIVKAQVKADTDTATKVMQEDIKRADELRASRQKTAEEAQKAKEELALREENCNRARTRLASYSVPRGRIYQADGSLMRPSEEERQEKLKEAQAWVDEWCK